MSAVDVASNNNKNMSEADKELLRMHFRLGHVNFKTLTWMIRSGKAQVQNPKFIANVYPFPKRAACEFGKVCCQGSDATLTSKNPAKKMELKKGDLSMSFIQLPSIIMSRKILLIMWSHSFRHVSWRDHFC